MRVYITHKPTGDTITTEVPDDWMGMTREQVTVLALADCDKTVHDWIYARKGDVYVDPEMMLIRDQVLPVSLRQMFAWQKEGMLIQEAMPHLSPSQREYIMTGLTDNDWAEMFDE